MMYNMRKWHRVHVIAFDPAIHKAPKNHLCVFILGIEQLEPLYRNIAHMFAVGKMRIKRMTVDQQILSVVTVGHAVQRGMAFDAPAVRHRLKLCGDLVHLADADIDPWHFYRKPSLDIRIARKQQCHDGLHPRGAAFGRGDNVDVIGAGVKFLPAAVVGQRA